MNEERKKIGLVTFYSDNYGSCLQAFALYNTIKNMGFDPVLVRYSRTNQGESRKGLLNKLKNHSVLSLIKALLNYRMIHGKKESFNKFREKQFPFTEKSYSKNDDKTELDKLFDVFVCGSDMMWCETFQQDWEHHFLRFTTKDKRVSYAPSFGINSISEENLNRCREYLSGFRPQCLSCRDISGVEMIKEKFGLESHHVVDPTMLFTKEQWNSFISDERFIQKPYVLLYLFGGQKNGRDKILQQVQKWNIGSLKSISINGNHRINNPNIGPFEYLRLFRDAEFIITDTFHGLMFSLIYEKPFVVLTREDGLHWSKYSDRMTAQLDMLGIPERYHDSNLPMPDSFKNLNYSSISEKIACLRDKSLIYLQNAISGLED